MKKCVKYFYSLLLILTVLFSRIEISFAQNKKIDSLYTLLKNDKPACPQPCIGDTNKVSHLNALAREFFSSNPDTSILLSDEALRLAEKINLTGTDGGWQMGIAISYHQIGLAYYYKDDYSLSLQFYFKALDVWDKLLSINNSDKMIGKGKRSLISYKRASTLGNIGIVYRNQGDYPKALDFYFKALKIVEDLGNKNGIANHLGNIGLVYWNQGDFKKALSYYFKALKLDEEINDKKGIAVNLGNIGIVYVEQKNYPEALDYYLKALKIDEELGNRNGIARHLGNIGLVYKDQAYAMDLKQPNSGKVSDSLFIKALDYYLKALKMDEELENKKEIAGITDNMGELYIEMGSKSSLSPLKKAESYLKAEKYLQKSLSISQEIGALNIISLSNLNLSVLYAQTGKDKQALEHYKQAMIIKDTLFNKDKEKEITRKEMNFEFEKKEANTKAQQEKKYAVARAESKKQKIVMLFIAGGLLLVLVFSGFVFRSLRFTRKQNIIIEDQKKIVEEKNKDIIDSINYAKRIQNALFREEEHVSAHLPEHFILFKPKDIVSGDFYWGLEKQNQFYIAAVDCTGHGVPGAFMSMLGVAFLNEITAKSQLLSPAEILEQLRDKIVKELRQSGKQQETRDGMDISLMRLNLETKELQWAGANNSIYIIKNKELSEIKPNKQPIGYHSEMQPFTNHRMQLESGVVFYLFTDGYADQFGGEKGKKFKYSKLKELLISMADKPMFEQKKILNTNFESWKGTLDQVDDVCVIGIRV
jgi:tetratricopeptide (TPR) repeat protein